MIRGGGTSPDRGRTRAFDRGEIRWRLVWGADHASSVRGVNLMRVRDGRIVEAQGYVKGA